MIKIKGDTSVRQKENKEGRQNKSGWNTFGAERQWFISGHKCRPTLAANELIQQMLRELVKLKELGF